jgi:Chalcone isomerase-like
MKTIKQILAYGALGVLLLSFNPARAADPEAPPALPPAVQEIKTELKPTNPLRFRKFGFHVYDANLWLAGAQWAMNEIFALDIRYARNIKGSALMQKSVDEMERMNFGDETKRKRWGAAMARIFPDVKADDRLVGLHIPGKETRFYSNAGLLGVVDDPEFAEAFFSIWLDPRTSEPSMRKKLLGLS